MSSVVSSPGKAGAILLMGAILAMTFVGCSEGGPKLGAVTGKVTLEGQPVPSAYIVFQPIDRPGTYGSAYTGVDGQYTLRYSRTRDGALVGRHQVSITMNSEEEADAEEKSARRGRKSKGEQNRMKGSFEREVKSGKNVHDFDLADLANAPAK